jgi:hypothetical protein
MTVNVPIKRQNMIHTLITLFAFLVSLLAMLFLIIRIFQNPKPLDALIVIPLFYTTQSNVLVFLVIISYLLKQSSKKHFQILALIASVDILLTGLVFHIFLAPYMEVITFMQRLLHTWTPIAYLMFYFIVIQYQTKLSRFWYAIIHPLIFFISVYLWIEPFLGALIENTVLEFEGSGYLYPFLNPRNFEMGFTGVLLFNMMLILPIILLLSFGVLYTKKQLSNNN